MAIFSKRPDGMNAFYTIWVGQFFSLLGTGMTRFALTLWAWELTGSATALAFVAFFSFLPGVVFSPIAGALVDRWDRKLVMMMSDLAAGIGTIPPVDSEPQRGACSLACVFDCLCRRSIRVFSISGIFRRDYNNGQGKNSMPVPVRCSGLPIRHQGFLHR